VTVPRVADPDPFASDTESADDPYISDVGSTGSTGTDTESVKVCVVPELLMIGQLPVTKGSRSKPTESQLSA